MVYRSKTQLCLSIPNHMWYRCLNCGDPTVNQRPGVRNPLSNLCHKVLHRNGFNLRILYTLRNRWSAFKDLERKRRITCESECFEKFRRQFSTNRSRSRHRSCCVHLREDAFVFIQLSKTPIDHTDPTRRKRRQKDRFNDNIDDRHTNRQTDLYKEITKYTYGKQHRRQNFAVYKQRETQIEIIYVQ